MGMLEDDLQRPDKPCGKCGSRSHWESECFMNSRAIDTASLKPIKIDNSTAHRQQQARIVREALEAVAQAEPDSVVRERIINVARTAHTETLAYLARLLKA